MLNVDNTWTARWMDTNSFSNETIYCVSLCCVILRILRCLCVLNKQVEDIILDYWGIVTAIFNNNTNQFVITFYEIKQEKNRAATILII